MEESKNIERLFQEKLKNLEITPNPAVWNKIEQSMVATPKKSKKGFIWFFSSSVAALFLLGFFLFKDYSIFQNPQSTSKTIIENKKDIDSTSTIKNNSKESIKSNIADNNIKQKNSKKEESLKDRIQNNNNNKQEIAVPKKGNIKTIHSKNYIVYNSSANIKNDKNSVINNNTALNKELTNISNPENKQKHLSKDNQKKDIVVTTILEKKDLSEEVNNKVNNLKTTQKNWSIAPVVSELFYKSLSNKSPVDSRLDNASKNGESSTSFGLKIAYQASKKWRIQTGVHKIDLAQTTENITIATISRNSSFANSSHNISDPVIKNDEISFSPSDNTSNELSQSNTDDNQLKQSFGYIEIPIEVNYQLFETRKLQLHLVGGLSSLFLTTNNLQIENSYYSYSDGEATNLNSVNFSFNLGTAAEYHFSKQWFFNVSPMLKIQTKTFNNTNNKPYLLGVSSGINYQF